MPAAWADTKSRVADAMPGQPVYGSYKSASLFLQKSSACAQHAQMYHCGADCGVRLCARDDRCGPHRVADMHAVFENSKMHMHVTKLLNEMQFKRSVYSTFCGLACSAEMKWSLHCPITCYSYMLQLHVAATMARDVTFFWPSDMQKCLAQNWQNAETGTVATMRCHIFRDD